MDTPNFLDLEVNQCKQEAVLSGFEAIAKTLLNSCILIIKGKDHLLREIEFYLNCQTHPDVFAHSTEDQLTSGQWAFHKTGSSYRGGSFKGLDITFGIGGYGGILIRAIEPPGGDYIDGPSKVVDKILELTQTSSIVDLVGSDQFSLNVFKSSLLQLKSVTDGSNLTSIVSSARIGLTLRNEAQVPFVIKPYRFMSKPDMVRKGRQHLVLELHFRGKSAIEVAAITNCRVKQCQKWIDEYEIGISKNLKPEDFYNKILKTAEFSEFYYTMKQHAL